MKIVLQNLTKIFPSRNKKSGEEVVAVNNFDFTIPDGKLIGLLGPSGCGKSTTLYMISGLQKPSSGKIFFGEDDVTDLSTENRGIGLVFQNYALYPHLTVKQNSIDAENAGVTKSVYLFVPEETDNLDDFVRLNSRTTKAHYELDDEGVIITEKLARLLDVKAGEILSSASYPTYDLSTYSEDFNELLQTACNRVIEFQPDSTILDRPGTYDDYLEWKRERLAQQK